MALWEKRGVICWERLGPIIGIIQLLLVEVVMEQTQPGAPWGGGHWGVQAESLQCSWRCAKMPGFKALAVKHRVQPQQGKRNSKLSLIREAPLQLLVNQQELSCLAHPTVIKKSLDIT